MSAPPSLDTTARSATPSASSDVYRRLLSPVGSWLSTVLAPFTVLIVFAVVWQIVTSLAPSLFFPTMTQILTRTYESFLSGPPAHLFLTPAVFDNIVPSLVRLLVGWAIAVASGVTLGVAIGFVRSFADYVDPVLQYLRSVPPAAIIPLYLILFGIGDTMKVALIATGVVWPILLNTIDGVRTIPSLQLDTGRIYGIGWRSRLTHIILPSAAPKIFAGMSIALSIAIILMVLSEMIAATNGLGFMILRGQRSFHITDMWAGIVVLGVLGFLLNTALLVVQNRVLAWHRGSKRRS